MNGIMADLIFCHQIPKVELHAHLNTSYSLEYLQEVVDQHGKDSGITGQDLQLSEARAIDESFIIFTKVQQFFRTEEAVYKLTCSVIKDFADDNVKYLELRSTPKSIPETGMTRELYVQTMIKAVRDCEQKGLDIIVRLLVSIDRRHGVEVAKETVELADKLKHSSNGLVIGIDFSGDPVVGDATDFIPVFLNAANRGLKLALHLAEIPAHEETKNVIQAVGGKCALRIGHGTYLHRYDPGNGHEEIEDMVLRWKIPVEACLTSNLLTKTVDNPGTHHFHYWRSKQHPVILCTDGKGVYGKTLSEEYTKAASEFNIGKKDLIEYASSTIDHIFAEDQVKHVLKEKLNQFKQSVS